MPRHDGPIRTDQLGHAVERVPPGDHDGPRDAWRVRFDTGIMMDVPYPIYETMVWEEEV